MDFSIKTRFSIDDKIWVFTSLGSKLVPTEVTIIGVSVDYATHIDVTRCELVITYFYRALGEHTIYGTIVTTSEREEEIAIYSEQLTIVKS